MHHLVTEWVTLPALSTWAWRSPASRSAFHPSALVGISTSAGLNRALGRSGPGRSELDPSSSHVAPAWIPARPGAARPPPAQLGDPSWSAGPSVSPGSDSQPCGPCQGCLQKQRSPEGATPWKRFFVFHCSVVFRGIWTPGKILSALHLRKFNGVNKLSGKPPLIWEGGDPWSWTGLKRLCLGTGRSANSFKDGL